MKEGLTITQIADRLNRNKSSIYRDKDIFSILFKSITIDNGIEFLNMESLEKSVSNKLSKRTAIYYSHAYCSWERASNENNNKLIRKFIKKKKILNISREKIASVLNISIRFACKEPLCNVTRQYNKCMYDILSQYNIEFK